MNLRKAFSIVLDLAMDNIISEHEMPEENARQREAWALVHAAGRRINGDTNDA